MSKIYVTESFLPPQDEYNAYLEKLWDSKWLTNRGPLVLEMEEKLEPSKEMYLIKTFSSMMLKALLTHTQIQDFLESN